MANVVKGAKSPISRINRKPKSIWKTRTATFSRWLHIYLSMFSFIIVLFFAVTGLTLNHTEWFNSMETVREYTGSLEKQWVAGTDSSSVKKLEIAEFLRKTYRVNGEVSDFYIDETQCLVSFKGPGYSADVSIQRENGEYQLTETRLGIVAVMNDLHKGRDTGSSWSYVIDIAAIFMSLVSVTGIIMICFMKKKRFTSFILVGAGLIISFAVYYWFVK